MKLWEVLKELEDNPKKVFECDTGSRIKFFDNRLHWCDKHGNPEEAFEIRDKRSGTGVCHNTGDIWQEVKQPVTWQEAIEAWANGKTIKCEVGGLAFTYNPEKNTTLFDTFNKGHMRVSEITEGTWYIEGKQATAEDKSSREDMLRILLEDDIEAIKNGDIYEHGYPESRLIPANHRSVCEDLAIESAIEKVTYEVESILKNCIENNTWDIED